ncbi:Two-component response regulator SSK1p [Sporothrix epigloea]|uniref:Two-component response regulator SSK1p n=1 Tax=Sporothrix epigloea TaxID=1892477 RepID=A0ABP0DPH5_9PEZI
MSASAQRKVWVRRPDASATLVTFSETDVVDDVREMLLRKYGNSLGRVYDAPDVTLRLIPRETHQGERTLAPDELMTRTLDVYYPGGQSIDEALVIDVPTVRRATPSASPRGGPPHAYNLVSVQRDRLRGAASDYSPQPSMAPDYFGPGVVPDYYNHATLTVKSDYGNATLAPESAAALRAAANSQYSHKLLGASSGILRPSTNANAQPASVGGGGAGSTGNSPLNHPHSISIIATGQAPPLPNLPSPGGTSRRSHKDRADRPKLSRQTSAADGGLSTSQISGSANGITSELKGQTANGLKIPIAAPIAGMLGSRNGSATDGLDQQSKGGGGLGDVGGDKDVTVNGGNNASSARSSVSSPARTMSPMHGRRVKKVAAARGMTNGNLNGTDSSLNGTTNSDERKGSGTVKLGPLMVPPINVLIVEDNIINLKLLEAFAKRLKVRWQTAMNGRDAVIKWRTGGFHLVLMDIQLPLMSGLDATREIRRLERVNSIGVFASTPSDSIGVGRDPQSDKLANLSLFKSPVIIVALTASSLQSDRNDALAAGCNDFLTKPVNFVWLEKKVIEWGCMQALIDFEGWRKWKEEKSSRTAVSHQKKQPPPPPPQQQQVLPPPPPPPQQQQQQQQQQPDSGEQNSLETKSTPTKPETESLGHAKRPSVTAGHETAGSSETTNTVASTDSPSSDSDPKQENGTGGQEQPPAPQASPGDPAPESE